MTAIENDIVAAVGRRANRRVAPQELPLFRSISGAFFKDPGRARPRDRGRDDVLGFGTVEATLLTHETEGGLREALAGGVNGAVWYMAAADPLERPGRREAIVYAHCAPDPSGRSAM